jgi:hypothetical protein
MAAADDGQRMAGSHTLQGGVASTDLNSFATKQGLCRRSRRRKQLPKVDGAAADLRDQAMAGREIGASRRVWFTSPQRGEVGLRLAMRSIVQCNPGEGPQRSVKP